MTDSEREIFIKLFREACEKCFGIPLISPLSEPDCRIFSNKILESTGLVIGQKTIRNYSLFVLDKSLQRSGKENPGTATLDTLARYVLNAPVTDEIKRKQNENHHPYWYQYKSRFAGKRIKNRKWYFPYLKIGAFILLMSGILVAGILIKGNHHKDYKEFLDEFDSVNEDSLRKRGWIFTDYNPFWEMRDSVPGVISLFTLRGDNWPLGDNQAKIRNLLMREIDADCFFAEIHLSEFIPRANWQSAGIILSEDSTFSGKMMRISISYNDFFGGYSKSPEIILQILSSSATGNHSKPEEVAHIPLFTLDPGTEETARQNLASSALKVQKKGNRFSFLYTTSSTRESFAFHEAESGDFDFKPHYISLFAIKGWSDNEDVIKADFDSFTFMEISCR